uniref:Ig-like domain-containing protein n=1 Tax=Anolis carolinensis TaxID=28377 RepID=A0A803THT7_ANOCA
MPAIQLLFCLYICVHFFLIYYFSVFFLTSLAGVCSQVTIIESGGDVKKPGETLRLICTVSGFSITDIKYAVGWIRQPSEKNLEWIGEIWYDGSTYYKSGFQNQISISKDISKSQVILQLNSLKTEDTAVYYCTRRTVGKSLTDYFFPSYPHRVWR